MIKQKFIPALTLIGTMALGAVLWGYGEISHAKTNKTPESVLFVTVPYKSLVIENNTMTPSPKPSLVPPKPTKSTVKGLASYYSRAGCLGCSETLTMANGEPLDDNRLTIAYNYGKLNSVVEITNTKTGKKVTATVTDRGGFERHGKIADLSVATRDALGCGHVCSIELVTK